MELDARETQFTLPETHSFLNSVLNNSNNEKYNQNNLLSANSSKHQVLLDYFMASSFSTAAVAPLPKEGVPTLAHALN